MAPVEKPSQACPIACLSDDPVLRRRIPILGLMPHTLAAILAIHRYDVFSSQSWIIGHNYRCMWFLQGDLLLVHERVFIGYSRQAAVS